MIGHQSQGTSSIRMAIERWFAIGLEAVDPYNATRSALRRVDGGIDVDGKIVPLASDATVVGLAIGKAAAPMARALQDALGDRLDHRVLITKDGHLGGAPAGWQLFEASHPVPDARGVLATSAALQALACLTDKDLVIVLVSGGGSAIFEAPIEPLELDHIRQVTDLLLRAGAPIQDLNAVRSELSQVKGGGLRRQIGPATCISLILSDVLGNDPTVIASGPTISRSPDPARALAILESYGLLERIHPAVKEVLQTRKASSLAGVTSSRDRFVIVGDNQILVHTVAAAARKDGFSASIELEDAEGEASTLASEFLAVASEQPESVDVVVGGGEATVKVTGDGIGGRNTEFALAAAQELAESSRDWVVASLASDGQDGANQAAGAIVDRWTTQRGDLVGLSAMQALRANDSGTYLGELDELVVTGPTGTNVNDVYIAVRNTDRTRTILGEGTQ